MDAFGPHLGEPDASGSFFVGGKFSLFVTTILTFFCDKVLHDKLDIFTVESY